MSSKAGAGGLKPQDDALDIMRRLRGDLENLSSGTAYWDTGRPSAAGYYPIDYQAKTIPPVYEDIQLATGLLGKTPNISVEVSDEDRRIMKQKVDMKDVAQLHKRFFETYKPMNDPVRYWTLRKIWPEPFEAMERAIEKRADMQKDIQKKMLGEPTKETLLMLMALQDSAAAQTALSQPVGPNSGVAATNSVNDVGLASGLISDTQLDYTRGLAAVARYFTSYVGDDGKGGAIAPAGSIGSRPAPGASTYAITSGGQPFAGGPMVDPSGASANGRLSKHHGPFEIFQIPK